jgi:hypothetical protein
MINLFWSRNQKEKKNNIYESHEEQLRINGDHAQERKK